MEGKSEALTQVLRSALNLLADREHTRKELMVKLSQRGFDPAVISSAIEHCITQGWLDETRFCEIWIRSRANRGFGPQRIAAELWRKGVDADLVRSQLSIFDCDWFDLAYQCCQCRLKGQSEPIDNQQRQRLFQFMVRRGFTLDQVRFALDGSRLKLK